MAEIDKLQSALTLNIAGFTTAINAAISKAGSFSAVSKKIFAGVAGYLSFSFFSGIIRRAANLGDKFDDLSARSGLAVDFLVGLDHAAKLSATSVESLVGNTGRLMRTLGEARGGSKEALDAFAELGISREQLSQLGTGQQAFLAVHKALSKIPDEFQKAMLAQKIFGRGAQEIGAILRMQTGELERMIAEGQRLTGITAENAGIASQFNDQMVRLNAMLDGIIIQIGAALLPTLIDLAQRFLDWIGQNQELINQDLPVVITRIAQALLVVVDAAKIVYNVFEMVTGVIMATVGTAIKGLGYLAEKGSDVWEFFGGEKWEGAADITKFGETMVGGGERALDKGIEGLIKNAGGMTAGRDLFAPIKQIAKEPAKALDKPLQNAAQAASQICRQQVGNESFNSSQDVSKAVGGKVDGVQEKISDLNKSVGFVSNLLANILAKISEFREAPGFPSFADAPAVITPEPALALAIRRSL